MSNDQDQHQEKKSDPSRDWNQGSDTQASEDIIELTDVVREGKPPQGSDMEEPILLDDEKVDFKEIPFTEANAPETIDSPSPLSEAPGEETTSPEEDEFSPLESSDFKFDSAPTFEAPDTEPLREPSQQQLDDVLAGIEKEAADLEKPEDILAEFDKDRLEPEAPSVEAEQAFQYDDVEPSQSFASGEDEVDETVLADEEPEVASATQDMQGISEEKMKALMTEVIQGTVLETVRETVSEATEKVLHETVDRAVRETVSEVAEKVILEAMDALKKSIASSEL